MEIRRSGFRNFSKSGRSGSGRDQEIIPPGKLVELKGSESDLRRQSVTEPEPMLSPINNPAYQNLQ